MPGSLPSQTTKNLFLLISCHFAFTIRCICPFKNVIIPALIRGESKTTAIKRATELLEFLNVSHRTTHKPNEMSGGEKQRVAVARALINDPSLILADEPSGSLDSKNKEELHRLLFDLRDRFGLTVVIVTHDKELAALSDRVIEMKDGLIKLTVEN